MLLLLQIILCCLLYFALVKCAVRDSERNCLYFYPDAYLDEAQKRGIADKTEELRKGKRFMTFFCLVIFVVLIAVIAGWNGVKDFHTACFEAYLFLVVMNWFDGLVIDLLWVGHSKIWRIEGMEGVPYGRHQAQRGHDAVPSCRGRGRRDCRADWQNLNTGRKKVPKPLAWEPFSHRRAMQRIKGEVHKEVWKRSFQIRLRISAPMALQPTSWQFSCMMSPQRKPERSVLSTARSMASAAMSKL